MFITRQTLESYGVQPSCILHVGAHEAEELTFYKELGCTRVLWVEALSEKSEVLQSVIGNEPEMAFVIATIWSRDGETVNFFETNNGQSSSILEFDKHRELHPEVEVVKRSSRSTKTIDTMIFKNFNQEFLPDMINLDIQGAEFQALQGAVKTLESVKWVYTEVSFESIYMDSVLEPELTALLASNGFTAIWKAWTDYGWGEMLYARNV